MYRKILHLDMDAFFCAVEEIINPFLKGKPFVVGGRPETRGVVASCSYAARKFGIRSAMPMAHAVKRCPPLIIISSRHHEYLKYSKRVMSYVKSFSPLIEQISIDEAFLDVSDLPESGKEIAIKLQSQIVDNLSLPCSFGVATNKLLAKTANNVGKASSSGDLAPNAITVVQPGDEAGFLSPLPVEMLWGVGPKTADHLRDLGILTIGDLANKTDRDLVRIFGKHGHDLALRAKGIDNRPVETSHELKSVSHETTFISDTRDEAVLIRTIRILSDNVGKRLRRANKSGKTVKIKLRWADYKTITRQMTLENPTDNDQEIFLAALELFKTSWIEGKHVRLIGVGVSGFEPVVRQLNFWIDLTKTDSSVTHRLQNALDTIRDQYGDNIIRRASDL